MTKVAPLYFITGSSGKFQEAQGIIPHLRQLSIDLPEIQDIDPHVILREKLRAAQIHAPGCDLVVEDTSLYFDCLNGKLPGPLIKWFERAIGNEGLAQLTERSSRRAVASCIVGHFHDGKVHFYQGSVQGTIVPPRGTLDFGWDPIFQPDGYELTFGEMDRELKNSLSMRAVAFRKLHEVLKRTG